MTLVMIFTIVVALSLIAMWRTKDPVIKDVLLWTSLVLVIVDIVVTAWIIAASL